ncbi:MAG TPA: TonB-dependent receptor [Steroidobacteraceae bacterium]
MRIARSTLIGTAVAMALFGRNAAVQAQQSTTAADSKSNDLQEVVVYGIRASLRDSMQTKKDATGVEEVLTAEDVGKFPDKNLAEALQRVPGIVTQKDFGEGERINLRGTNSTLTQATLNGHGLSTADWFILDQQSATRSFNYLMLPADLIGKVEVQKTAQADVQEGGIGGTVNVETRKPLDLQPVTAYASLEGSRNDRAAKTNPYATGLVSFKDQDNRFGFLLAAVYQDYNIRRDGFEVLGYAPISGTNPTLIPTLINSALFEQDRIRKGANFDVQIRPNDQLEFNFNGLLSIFNAENTNQSWLADPQRAIGNGGSISNCVVQAGACVAGTVSSLNNGTQDFAFFYDSFHRLAKTTSHNLDLDTKYTPQESWTLHLDLGWTAAVGKTDPQFFPEFGAPGAFTYDFRNGAPQVHPIPNGNGVTVDFSNPNSFAFDFANADQFENDDRETYVYADALKELDFGALKSIKFGVKGTNHERDASGNFTTYGAFSAPILQKGIPTTAWSAGLSPGNFLSGISVPGSLTQAWIVNPAFAAQVLGDQVNVAGRVPYPTGSFTINEKTYGGYVMGNFAGDNWRGNLGVRLAHTLETTGGAQFVANPNQPGVIPSLFGAYIPVTASKSYNDILPSLNFAYDVTKEVVVRFAAAKVMSRPDYTDMVPRVVLNTGALSGTAGNPNIDPYRATQEDLSIEWYPSKDTAYSLAIYNKNLKNFIVDNPTTQILPFSGATAPNALCTPAGTQLFNCPFAIDVKANGGNGTLRGVEVGLVQHLWGGFGVQANYSYSDASLDSGKPFPGNSKNTYNLTGYFENTLFSARLAYTYRSNFFQMFDRTSNLDEAALKSLDASFAWNVTSYAAVIAEAQNLTDAKVVEYDDVLSHPRAIYDNGRTFFAGVKLRF